MNCFLLQWPGGVVNWLDFGEETPNFNSLKRPQQPTKKIPNASGQKEIQMTLRPLAERQKQQTTESYVTKGDEAKRKIKRNRTLFKNVCAQ